ncbi:MAG TPA: hypothetical protein VGH16_04785 [Candidatus Binatia bacterium]
MSVILFCMSLILLIACSSPETTRTRGGGAGADVGNRDSKTVLMHEGSDPYANTPKLIPAQGPPLAPARQAEQLSQ